nr:MAG TPA: hypothetical protein [Caudoviricetes sp.]
MLLFYFLYLPFLSSSIHMGDFPFIIIFFLIFNINSGIL